MGHAVADKLVCLLPQSAPHAVRGADGELRSYTQSVEKWDSYSDTDASDDDNLAM